MIRLFCLYILLLLMSVEFCFAQNKIITLDTFFAQLKSNHPVAMQGQIKVTQAEAGIVSAKGSFDPILQFENAQKTLDNKNYYTYQNTEIKYLTPYGIQVKAGQERSNGQFFNPENTPGGLNYLGVSVPLLRGLLIDKQRAAVKQAVLFRSESVEMQKVMLNDLYLSALEAYVAWAGSFQNLAIIERNLSNTKSRFEMMQITFKNGDRAAVDTLEALTQVQNVLTIQLQAQQEYNTTAIYLSNYLWTTQNEPYLLAFDSLPDLSIFTAETNRNVNDLLDNLQNTQAQLGMYTYKLASLQVEKRLKYQYFLPQANLQYNILNADNLRFNTSYSPYLTNNYKIGFEFKMPLFLREAKGDYRKVNLKIKEIELELVNKNWELKNKIRSHEAEILILEKHMLNTELLVKNYTSLVDFETLKLQQGESSLFLINSRENKLIESQLKLQELKVKFRKTIYKQLWAAGKLTDL